MSKLFKCPKCGAEPQEHGKGRCLNDDRTCDGLICECSSEEFPESEEADHGESFTNLCTNANCYHCGWGGKVPQKPKGLQAWEKKALDAGWTMPVDRAKELGL